MNQWVVFVYFHIGPAADGTLYLIIGSYFPSLEYPEVHGKPLDDMTWDLLACMHKSIRLSGPPARSHDGNKDVLDALHVLRWDTTASPAHH